MREREIMTADFTRRSVITSQVAGVEVNGRPSGRSSGIILMRRSSHHV